MCFKLCSLRLKSWVSFKPSFGSKQPTPSSQNVLSLDVSVLEQPVLPIDVYVLQQPECDAPGGVCSIEQPVLHKGASVRQQPILELDVSDPGGVWPTAACAVRGRVGLQ
jgi:hypothetical protein